MTEKLSAHQVDWSHAEIAAGDIVDVKLRDFGPRYPAFGRILSGTVRAVDEHGIGLRDADHPGTLHSIPWWAIEEVAGA